MTRRKGNIFQKVATADNFRQAECCYADGKQKRRKVVKFERDLEGNLSELLSSLTDGTWVTPQFREKIITEHGKSRPLGIYPAKEHIMEWAFILHLEHLLTDTYVRSSCSCVKGRGPLDFINLIYHDLYNDYEGTYYFVQLDAHHFFLLICHEILYSLLEGKIKDQRVLDFLWQTIENYPLGIVLGTKLSQIEGNFYLAKFDHDMMNLFGILDDNDKYAYWCNRYVSDCIVTCRTEEQASELNKGVEYLKGKFHRLCEEWIVNKHYYRFADNILMLMSDKTFLHLLVEMATARLWTEYKVQINKSWNVRPVEPDGIDICGYVLFHDHIAVRKRNKQELCRQVAKLRKKGLSPEEIRLKAASRIGWHIHADARTLIRKLNVNMEFTRLGKVIKKNKHFIPFDGLKYEDHESIECLLCRNERDEKSRMIMLLDFKITPSLVKEDSKTLWIKYKYIKSVTKVVDKDGNPILDKDGNEKYDYETYPDVHYTCTSSNTLLDQAEKDIPHESLPMPTAIYEVRNKIKSKYYKFT